MKNEAGKPIWWSMPWLFDIVVKSSKRIDRFDYRRPVTLMSELEGDLNRTFEEHFARDTNTSHLGGLRAFCSHVDLSEVKSNLEDCARAQKRLAAADSRYSLILKLIRSADTQVPFVSYFAMQPYLDPTFLRRLCEPIDLLQQAETETGEVRARALVRSVREIAEMLYDPYLRMLWNLSCFATGDRRQEPRDFGDLVKGLSKRLAEYPGLVEKDAGWIRNATAHAQWCYIPSREKLKMWDRSHSVEEIAIDDLSAMANGMFSIAGPTAFALVGLYVFRDICLNTGLLDLAIEVLPEIFSEDQRRRTRAEKVFHEKEKAVFGPLQAFLQSMPRIPK